MKVFISWSGEKSQKLGEALRDWLPGVLQSVTPYFTPSDIEKGTRWSADISKELSESAIGILCITRDNIHSDWILFEAGALSKSLEKTHVCPILFGIANTDLAGPLKQFQTTEFDKDDMRQLLAVINNRLEEQKLPQKTLDRVFEKWWPDLETKIAEILGEMDESEEPLRPDRELLEEVLQISRAAARRRGSSGIRPGALKSLLRHFIELHDDQVAGHGDYQAVLNMLEGMSKAVTHISSRSNMPDEELEELIMQLKELSYICDSGNESKDEDEIPF